MAGCEDGANILQAKPGDQRVTRFGAFLRRTSLDELPQFIVVAVAGSEDRLADDMAGVWRAQRVLMNLGGADCV